MDTGPVRDFLWVEDAAAGLVRLALGNRSSGPGGGLYNLGSEVGVSIGSLAQLTLDLAGQCDRTVIATHPSGRASSVVVDCAKTRKDYGWRAETSLELGIHRLLKAKAKNQ
jgi:nucleoside-diphosphate-sugar epimerase